MQLEHTMATVRTASQCIKACVGAQVHVRRRTDLSVQKHCVPIQDIVPLEMVQEQQPLGAETQGSLHGFGCFVLISHQAIEQSAATRCSWCAVGDHLHAGPPKLVPAVSYSDAM